MRTIIQVDIGTPPNSRYSFILIPCPLFVHDLEGPRSRMLKYKHKEGIL